MKSFARQISCLFLALCLWGGPLVAQETPRAFDQAKQQLQQDQNKFLKNLAQTVGTAAAVTVSGKILYHKWQGGKSLRGLVEGLSVPWGKSRPVQYLKQEKASLLRETEKLEKLCRMIRRRQPKKTFFWQSRPELTRHEQRELKLLKRVLNQRYISFEAHLGAYKAAYKEYQKTRHIAAAEGRLVRPASPRAAKAPLRQTARILPKKWPLVFLLTTTLVSDTPDVRRMAQRLEQNPSLAFALTPQEEQTIRRSEELSDLYVHLAAQVHELAQLSPAQLQVLAEQAHMQQHQTSQMQAALRQSLVR